MASSVLGKRTRSSYEPASQQPSSRAKRQFRTDNFDVENQNPFITNAACRGSKNGDSMEVDDAPVQNPTPQTPRHRDALSDKVFDTPRSRVTVTGKTFIPRTPRTPVTPGGSITTIYNQARQLFTRSNEPGRLVGRESERQELTDFVQNCISKTCGGCTYVSGPPGTGKSAMVSEVTADLESGPLLKKAYVNCMSIKSSGDLYGTLLENLECDLDVLEGEEAKTLQGLFISKRKSKTIYVITLDEIDHILTLDLEVLYKLFEWSLLRSSRLVLIGIANALDLTDRFLPRLKARNFRPELLPFLPYNASQIKTIITTRLKSLVAKDSETPDYVPFLHPAAIDMCSRKVANQTGDLRKALDICRRAIDLIESETKQKHEQALQEHSSQSSPSKRPLEENNNLSSPVVSTPSRKAKNISLAQSLAKLTVETAPRAAMAHVNKATLGTFGNGANQRLKTLNLQQKAALCALVALEKRKREIAADVGSTPSKSRTTAPTIKALYDVYCMLCKRDSILHPLTSTEFRDVVGSLETLSLISAVDGKNGSFVAMSTPSKRARKFGYGVGVGDEKRVGCCVSEKEVAQAVEGLGAGILKSILSGEGLD